MSAGRQPGSRSDSARQDLIVSQAIVLSGRRIGTLMLLYDLGEIYERIVALWQHRAGRAAGFEPVWRLLLSSKLARRDRDADLATGARHHVGIGDRRLQHARAETSRATNWACWWIDSMRCWPASSRGTTI